MGHRVRVGNRVLSARLGLEVLERREKLEASRMQSAYMGAKQNKKIMLGYYALRVGMQPSHSIEAEVCISLQRIVGEVTGKV